MAKLINLIPKNHKPKTNESLEDMETVSLPPTMERFLDRTIGIIKGYNLNRKKEQLVIAKMLDALKLSPSELNQAVQKVKKYGVVTRQKTGNEEHDWMGEAFKLSGGGAGSGSQTMSWEDDDEYKKQFAKLKAGDKVEYVVNRAWSHDTVNEKRTGVITKINSVTIVIGMYNSSGKISNWTIPKKWIVSIKKTK